MSSLSNSNTRSSKSSTPNKQKQTKSTSNGPASNRNRNSEFICKLKYMNNLPAIPFDPKFLVYPFDKLRFVKYHTTSLDNTYKHVMHTEPDLGIPIDLIDPASYTIPSVVEKLPDEDMKILEPSDSNGKAAKKSRIDQVRPIVPWLRKNEFYMTPVSDELHKRSGEVPEVQFGKKTLQNLNEEEVLHFDKEKQIQAIQDTFDTATSIPRHPTKPELQPVEILPIFPDFDLWANRYTQVVLVEPLEEKMEPEVKEALKDQALIKFYGIDPARFFAYMVPKKRKLEEIEQNSNPTEGEEVEYEWVREYSYGVKKGTDPTYFFHFSPDGVYYNEITSKVTSVKSKFKEMPPLPSKITLVGKPMSAQETEAREKRMKDLQQQDFTDDFEFAD